MITTVAHTNKISENDTSANDTADARATVSSSLAVIETDVLVRLRSNLNELEDLHGRLKYVLGELSYLLKKD